MRALARRVGAALRDQVGFRGSFSIDGVLAEEGFLPTELNPRLGAGMNTLAGALGDPDASILFGPGPIGGFVSFTLAPGRNEPGPPSAPEVARAFRLADRLLGTDFGALEPARNVRQ